MSISNLQGDKGEAGAAGRDVSFHKPLSYDYLSKMYCQFVFYISYRDALYRPALLL